MKRPRSPLFFPVVLFIILIILLISEGFFYYAHAKRQITETAAGILEAVADLKVTVISRWRSEVLQSAEIVSANPINGLRIVPYLKKEPADAGSGADIRAWMDSLTAAEGFMDAILFDAEGRPRLTGTASESRAGSFARESLARVLDSGQPFLSDFHRAADIGLKIHVDLYAPVLSPGPAPRRAAGVFLFRVDPDDFLYPFLRSWPAPNRSAESYLVRREGDGILFLSHLRHRPAAALDFRLPASSSVIARAVGEQGGRFEGADYRGVRVMMMVKPIPGTPWFLVSQEDQAVIFQPLLSRMSNFGVMTFILCFGIGVTMLFWLKRREARHFKSRYETEHERLALVRHFEYLHKYANDVVFLTDRDHALVEVNDRALKVYGYTREEFLALHIPDLRPPEARRDFDEQLLEAGKTGSLIFETLHRRKNGEIFPVEVSLRIIDIGGTRFHQAIIRDISERKKSEQRVLDALREKEVLLREIHHRVKNNMQVISSLLRLQSSKFTDADVVEAFRESQDRIRSMALVHEKLYRTKNLSTIDLSDYIKTLTDSVFSSHVVSNRIVLQLDLEKTSLDINAAVPCGLILNELILNALKHAFPPGRTGKIGIELRENENGMIRLTVRDDGIGLPEGIDFESAESLGFQIVSLLVRQLDGRIDVRREGGTAVSVRFTPPRYAVRI